MVRKLATVFLTTTSMLVTACSSFQQHASTSSEAVYFDTQYYDVANRAPASLQPPPSSKWDGSEPIDSTYLRMQADYNFSLGEALSFEGEHQKALEAFKSVRVYDQKSARVPLRMAVEYVKLGKVTEALELAEEANKLDPQMLEARLLLGGLYSAMKLHAKAIDQYKAILKKNPNHPDAVVYLGALYADMKKISEASKYFAELAKNPEYETPYLAHYYMGRVWEEASKGTSLPKGETKQGAYQKAEAAYQKALSLKANHIDSVLSLAALYSAHKQEKRAVKVLTDYQKKQGQESRVAEVLAQHYLELEQYDEALEQLKILEVAGQDVLNSKVKVALIYIEKKNFELAAEKLSEILRTVPESDKIRFYLAAVYEEMGDNDKAIQHFSKIGADSQFFSESILHAAYLQKKAKRLDEAVSLLEKGVSQDEVVPQMYALYATTLDERGDSQKAVSILKTANVKFPDNTQILFFLGTIQDRIGDKAQVIETMKKVVDLDPNHIQGLNFLAFTYAEENKNLDEAEKLARRALEMEPHDGFILDTLGWVLYKRGQYKESIKVLEAAYGRQPNESIIAEHLGDAYNKHQLWDKARRMYNRAAEMETDAAKVQNIRSKITTIERQDLLSIESRTPASE